LRLLVISLDGFPGYYLDSLEIQAVTPNLQKWKQEGARFYSVKTVDPSVTYPAHTSMITGRDPLEHGIYSNTPLDPWDKNDGGWMWYAQDIQVPSIFEKAIAKQKKVISVLWPVTVRLRGVMGNVPQFWRKKNAEDEKLLEALSTEGLWQEIAERGGIRLSENSSDAERFQAAEFLWKEKKPDLLMLYTTDLDTAHHAYGVFSEEAKSKLKLWDESFGALLKEVRRHENSRILLISDHGFAASHAVCSPNVYLANKGWIDFANSRYDFIFKSNGGSGFLFSGRREAFSPEEEEALVQDLTVLCPGLEFRKPKHKALPGRNAPSIILEFHTQSSMSFSSQKKGNLYQVLNKPSFGHGFTATRKDMDTLFALDHGISLIEKPKSIKDLYFTLVQLLDLEPKPKSSP